MNSEITAALTLLGVGMITVFVVLSLVVLVGNLLIWGVNRFTPISIIPESNKNEAAFLAAITASVEVVTKGKGRIRSILKKKH